MSGAENVDDTDWALERAGFIGHALHWRHGWCRDDGNWTFGWGRVAWWTKTWWPWASKQLYYFTGWLERVFYTLKVIICVAWDRRRNMWADGNVVEVGVWDFRSWTSMSFYGTAYDWWVLGVGHGLRDWHYDVYETSSV